MRNYPSDIDILDYCFEKKNLSRGTQETYKLSFQFSEFTNRTLLELGSEAKKIITKYTLDEHNYTSYAVKFKKHFSRKKIDLHKTIRLYLKAIKYY